MNDHIDHETIAASGRSITQPKQRRALLTQTEILDTAAKQFDTLGYAVASVNTILADTHLSRGALYFHFPSKESIAQRLVHSWSTAVNAAFAEAATSEEPEVGQLRLVFGNLARQVEADQNLRAGMKLTFEPAVEGAHAAHWQWIDTTGDLVEAAIAAGRISDTAIGHRLAWNLCSGFAGAVQTSTVLHEDVDLVTRVGDVVTAHLSCATNP